MIHTGVTYAGLAGLCAALAGLSAKFALSAEDAGHITDKFPEYLHSGLNTLIVRILFGAAALLLNSVMLTFTAKALQLCSTTIQSVVTTSAVNFTVTVFLGTLVLNEKIGLLGILGMIFIQLGLFIISKEKVKSK